MVAVLCTFCVGTRRQYETIRLDLVRSSPEVIKSWLVSLTTESLELGNGEFGDKVRVYGGNSPESAERVFPPAFQKLMLELLER